MISAAPVVSADNDAVELPKSRAPLFAIAAVLALLVLGAIGGIISYALKARGPKTSPPTASAVVPELNGTAWPPVNQLDAGVYSIPGQSLGADAGVESDATTLTHPTGNVLRGNEGNGLIQFTGTLSTISWTNPVAETWSGFTVGVAPVPEPTSVIVFATIAGLAGVRIRRLLSRC